MIYLKSNGILKDSSRSWAISTLREVTLLVLILLMILITLMTVLKVGMILLMKTAQVKGRGLWRGPPPKRLILFPLACNNYHTLLLSLTALVIRSYILCYACCDLSMHAFPFNFSWWQRKDFTGMYTWLLHDLIVILIHAVLIGYMSSLIVIICRFLFTGYIYLHIFVYMSKNKFWSYLITYIYTYMVTCTC